MARQQTKKQHSQQNVRLPLIGSLTNRDESGLKDQRFLNIFPETRKVEAIESVRIFLNKRPGLSLYKAYNAGEGRGIIWFRNRFYLAIGNKVVEDALVPVSVITLTAATGPVGMTLGNSATIGDYLFICDGTGGWVVKDDGTVLTINNGSLRSISITSAGTGMTAGTYALTFTGGGGSGAAATYTVVGGGVSEITISHYSQTLLLDWTKYIPIPIPASALYPQY